MLPGNCLLEAYRGDTTRWTIRLWEDRDKTQPADLTGAIAAASIRQAGTTLRPPVTLECTIELPNIVNMVLLAGAAGLPARGHQGHWDLQITYADGRTQTVLAGSVDIFGDVTKPT